MKKVAPLSKTTSSSVGNKSVTNAKDSTPIVQKKTINGSSKIGTINTPKKEINKSTKGTTIAPKKDQTLGTKSTIPKPLPKEVSAKPAAPHKETKPEPTSTQAYLENLPDELVLQIFSHFHSIQELGRMSATCIRFMNLASQNELWESFYHQYAPNSKKIPDVAIKDLYMNRIFKVRRTKIPQNFTTAMQNKLNTENVMKSIQGHFQVKVNDEILNLNDKRSLFLFPLNCTVVCTDPSFVSIASTGETAKVTKVSSRTPPTKEVSPLLLKQLKTIQISMRSSYIDCSVYKPILAKQLFPATNLWREVASDALITLLETKLSEICTIQVGLWRTKDVGFIKVDNSSEDTKIEDREVAFFFFHFHNQHIVLNACHLHESQDPEKKPDDKLPKRPVVKRQDANLPPILAPPHRVKRDDLSKQYGLLDYTVDIQLRSASRVKWNSTFHSVYAKADKATPIPGFATFPLFEAGTFTHRFPENLALAWKSGPFSKIMENVGIVDINVFDGAKELMWQRTSAVKLESTEFVVNYNYPDDSQYYKITVEDTNKGMLVLELAFSAQEKSTIISSATLYLKKTYINNWFGTKYQ